MPIFCEPLGLKVNFSKNKQIQKKSSSICTHSPSFGAGNINFVAKGTGFPKKLLGRLLHSPLMDLLCDMAKKGKDVEVLYSKKPVEVAHESKNIYVKMHTNELKISSKNEKNGWDTVFERKGPPEVIADSIQLHLDFEHKAAKLSEENHISIKLPQNIDQ